MHTKLFSREDVQKSLNIINTTSPSGILIASVDAARSYMASKEGSEAMARTYELAAYAREQIHQIPGFIDEGKEHFLEHGCFNYDESKLVIGIDKLDIDGFQLYHLLKEKYDVMMELCETYAVLGIFAIGTKQEHVDHLINALKEISHDHYHPETVYPDHHFDNSFPFMLLRPRVAFHAPGKVVPVEQCDGAISKEQVMMYPPGIPFIVPGEVWSKELVERVKHYQSIGIKLLSSYHDGYEIVDTAKWTRFALYERRLADYYENRKTTPERRWLSSAFRRAGPSRNLNFDAVSRRYLAQSCRAGSRSFHRCDQSNCPTRKSRCRNPSLDLSQSSDRVPPAFRTSTAISIRYNDAWARDNMPLFVTNGKSLRSVDFRFNAWGGSFQWALPQLQRR
jgi:hypothetical protein